MRSLLFVPGNNPGMLINVDLLESDAIIIDLEDAVSPDEKDTARILVRNALRFFHYKTPIVVRINSLDTDMWMQDLDEIVSEKPDYVLLPKCNCPADIEILDRALAEREEAAGLTVGEIKLIALIETAEGVVNVRQTAKAGFRLRALALGAEDLTADLQCRRTAEGTEILLARQEVVCAARAAGIECIDTLFTSADDIEGLQADTLTARSLGFNGKLAINPRHISVINRLFLPSDEEVAYAREVVAALEEAKQNGKGAIALHGKMIDKPIVARAQQTLALIGEEAVI